jgi:hypothetical protein
VKASPQDHQYKDEEIATLPYLKDRSKYSNSEEILEKAIPALQSGGIRLILFRACPLYLLRGCLSTKRKD